MKPKHLIFFLLSISFSVFGQVKFVGLSSNPKLQNIKKLASKKASIPDTLSLPFIDDFAYDSLYPSQNLWLDRDVYINNNFAVNPPSIGVATFDLLNQSGLIYDTSNTNQFPADFLTSKFIDLSNYAPSDSIYLSFFYQPQGTSYSSPQNADSLVLQFRTSDKDWLSIWSVTGSTLKDFKQIMIPVIDTSYLKNSFQFRFFNYASIGGSQNQEDAINDDYWNLDYIVLDTARSINDTSHIDISFTHFNSSLFLGYYSVPWKHYNLNKMPMDSIDFRFRNLDKEDRAANFYTYQLYVNNTLTDNIKVGSINISAFSTAARINTLDEISNQTGFNSNIPSNLNDSTEFKVVKFYKEFITNSDSSYLYNDTSKYSQYFYNYYAYDDGSAESGLAILQSGEKYAFKIAPLQSDTLRGLSMFFNRYKDYGTADPSVFSLCVWDNNNGKPGDIIYQEDNISPKYKNGINSFSTYKFKEAVYVEDTIFVGFINDTQKGYSIGYDFNNDNNNQVYYTTSNTWYHLSKGTPMIRALMGDNFVDISVPESPSKESIKVYPNPTNNTLRIQLKEQTQYQLRIYNNIGRLLINKTIINSQNINLKEYGSGVYLILIQNKNLNITKKIIVL